MQTMAHMLDIIILLTCINYAGSEKVNIQRKNILFFMADDFRPEIGVYAAGDETFYKNIQTPNFDALTEDSLVMTRAYCQMGLCGPSRNSFLTGRRPDTTRVYDLDHYWRDTGGNFTTIPQYFKEQGYYTINVGKLFHPGESGGNNDKAYSWSETPYTASGESIWEGNKTYSWRSIDSETDAQYPQKDRFLTDYAIQKLQERAPDAISGEQPFFLGLGFVRPHLPMIAPEVFYDLYPEEDIQIAAYPYVPENFPDIGWSSWGELREYGDIDSLEGVDGSYNTSLPDWKAKELRRAYYACVSFIDSLFGEVVAELDRLGLSNNTIIVVTADHGFQLGEHSEWCKHTNFEESTHVPLILKIPGETDGGRITDVFVESIDLFPTLVEAAGVESISLCPLNSSDILVCHEGHSLMELVRGAQEWKKAAFFQYVRYSGSKMGYVVRTVDYQYVKWVEFRGIPLWNDRQNHELYDLAVDPFMTNNVAYWASYQDVVAEMDQMLQAGWRATLPGN